MDKEPKIVSRIFSKQGRENYDRIFRKDEEGLKLLESFGNGINGVYYHDWSVPTDENGNIKIEKENNDTVFLICQNRPIKGTYIEEENDGKA
jgi:hypothetical protein